MTQSNPRVITTQNIAGDLITWERTEKGWKLASTPLNSPKRFK